jgi:phosphatidylserine/phosphatidylglycerophosphate/cardiolipin synthase-like enzyme
MHPRCRGGAWSGALLLIALAALPAHPRTREFEVVTTVPIETAISGAGTRAAAEVWLEMIRGARRTLDIAEFYLSSAEGEALGPVVEAVLAAGRRGVKVRILIDAGMSGTYPETLALLRGRPGIDTRLFDWRKLTGGVLHAKYFIVDTASAYVGSQNFDWRALAHIHETGLRIRDPRIVTALARIFAADWDFSGGDRDAYQKMAAAARLDFPADAVLVSSPAPFNPPGIEGALDALLRLVDGAKERITVQLLSYSVEAKPDTGPFIAIDQALRRAAGRGVQVSILVADWNLRPGQVAGIRELARVPNIAVKFAVIPPARRGFIAYARVVHSKVLRVDDDICWVGTSNWGYDYFFHSRNVEVIVKRPGIARVLDEIFLSLWNGPYVHKLDPDWEYPAPRIF